MYFLLLCKIPGRRYVLKLVFLGQIFAHVLLAFCHGENWLALERKIFKADVNQRILHNEYVDYSREDLLHYLLNLLLWQVV
jgi:hypothetical protein